MRMKYTLILSLVAMVSLAILACGDDDDNAGDGGGDEPTATAEADGNGGEGGEPGDGNEPDDDGGPDFRSRGRGTVVIGDETFEFEAEWCVIETEDGTDVIIAGPSTTADGEPAYVEVEYHPDLGDVGGIPDAQVAVGVTDLFDINLGNPSWIGTAEGDYVAEINGGAHISFTSSTFQDRESDTPEDFEGSVEASCE